MISEAERRGSGLNLTTYDAREAEYMGLKDRVVELEEQERREAAAASVRREVGTSGTYGSAARTQGREVYGPNVEHSYFRDMVSARRGDWSAAERLKVNNDVVGRELRTGDMSVGGSNVGSQFAPPAWLVSDFVELARPYRVTANIVHREDLPSGVSSVNLPKISGGSSVAVQASENTAVSDTGVTTTSVSSGISTIAGKQTVSLQLLEQSGVPFDRVILEDLARAYAGALNVQVISGSGSAGQLRGLQNGSGVGSTTYTTAAPAFISTTAAASFYNKVISAAATINKTRYASPTAVIMHSDRWSWILEALDGQQRPQVVSAGTGSAYNAPAVSTTPTAGGAAGTLAGLPVFVDPQIPQNLGAGTNQDVVFVLKADDCYLYETGGGVPRLESFDQPFADTLTVLFRAVGWAAFLPDRYGPSVNVIGGTGLTTVTL